ncbi:3-phosphoshikimate 1-carboxyvinyltransferase [Bacteroidia bacterium]|nr:3-phosphoshikimate 1-carboxyvinyltransferase [Bacteroidia bacterium]
MVLEFIYGKNLKIQNPSNSTDTLIFKNLLKKIELGLSDFEHLSDDYNAEMGKIRHILDCEDCGAAYRFLTAVCAVTGGFWRITGTETLKKRPIKWLIDTLNEMSVQVRGTKSITFADNGDLLVSGGKLTAIEIHNCSTIESSQFLSALAMIQPKLSPKPQGLLTACNAGETLFNDPIPSKPYFDMTLKLMHQIENNSNEFTVEADWSACSYFLATMLLNEKIDEVFFPHLKFSGLQGDQICADIFAKFGLRFCENNGGILVKKSDLPEHTTEHSYPPVLQQDFTNCPDLYPALKVLSWILKINTDFTGKENLIYKESNRVANIDNELENFDKNPDNYMLKTYNDHRLAMAFALLKVKNHNVKIENPDCVKKSFPIFWSEFKKMLTLS